MKHNVSLRSISFESDYHGLIDVKYTAQTFRTPVSGNDKVENFQNKDENSINY